MIFRPNYVDNYVEYQPETIVSIHYIFWFPIHIPLISHLYG